MCLDFVVCRMSASSDSEWSDAPELEEDENECASLLFPSQFRGTPTQCLKYDFDVLGWNIKTLGRDEHFDIFDFLKCTNFCRERYSNTNGDSPNCLKREDFMCHEKVWKNEKYLKPVDPEDPFLCFDWEDMADDEEMVNRVCTPFTVK